MHLLTSLFLVTLVAGLGLELWLYRRHARHVLAHRERVPEAFAGQVQLADHQKAADYTQAKIRLGAWELFQDTALLLLWTLGGGLALLLSGWANSGLGPLPAGIAAVLSVLLLQGLLELPGTWWRTFRLEARFGFNRTTPGRFMQDLLLATVLTLVLGGPLIAALLWLMTEAGVYWWLYAWTLWLGFLLFVTWLYPTLIAPLFNRFEPLRDPALEERIQTLARHCGFTPRGIYVMDGSRRSAHGNAYFTGLGRHKRIVFFDTLLDTLEPDELAAVLAHELGHYRLRHVQTGLLLHGVLSGLGFALLGWLANWPAFYTSFGVAQPSAAAALLLFLLVLPVFTRFFNPLAAWLMRRHEHQADDFAVARTGAAPLIRALVRLYRDNASTLTPDPLFSAFHDSHPPAPVRIARIASSLKLDQDPFSRTT